MGYLKTRTYCVENFTAREITVEIDISRGLYNFSIIGLADKAVGESKDRIQSAIKNSEFKAPKSQNRKITVLLAPASIKKEGSGFDLAIAIAYLSACHNLKTDNTDKFIFIAELSLSGELRAPKNYLFLFREILKTSHDSVIVTSEECREVSELFINSRIVFCKNLTEVFELISIDQKNISRYCQVAGADGKEILNSPSFSFDKMVDKIEKSVEKSSETNFFNNIQGCESAKRALSIAVAGRHNILIVGPPGTGKTLLAKSVLEITPTLSIEESYECTALQFLSNNNSENCHIVLNPPMRHPHHTSSYASIVGDFNLNPGEVTKSHNGFLFLDELAEFDSRVIESLREPMESQSLTLSKRKGSVTMPANFTLIATMNPCKCGFAGSSYKKCKCTAIDVIRYSNKISGPVLDRFDLIIQVDQYIEKESEAGDESKIIKQKINNAINFSRRRFFKNFPTEKYAYNGKLNIHHMNPYKNRRENGGIVHLSEELNAKIQETCKKLKLSRRGFVKILKVARTIADIEQTADINEGHLLEALSYRQN